MRERKNHSFLDFFSQNRQNLFLLKFLYLDQFHAATVSVSHWFHSLLACNICKLLVPSFQPIPCLHTWNLQLLKVLFIDFSKNGHISKYLQVIWILHASFLQIHHHQFHFGHEAMWSGALICHTFRLLEFLASESVVVVLCVFSHTNLFFWDNCHNSQPPC
jgi:hypothetical protein